MYIWVGVEVEDQIAEIKKSAFEIEKKIGFENSNFTLPMHISLKISFLVPDSVVQGVMDDIEALYCSVTPFSIEVDKIECYENIAWIRYKQNDYLDSIHDQLNSMLLEKYGVGLHEYDCDYKFHTTLFMENNEEKIRASYEMVRNTYLPKTISVNKLLIGASDSGGLGTYRVVREVNIDRNF